MKDQSIVICIGGEAGQGLDTMSQMLAKILVRCGYEILASQVYMSRIRGGHNYYLLRTGPEEISSPGEKINLLVALNEETVHWHRQELDEENLIIMDSEIQAEDLNALAVPFEELAEDSLQENVVALGCTTAILGLDQEVVSEVISQTFGKSEEMEKKNLDALQKAFSWIKEQSYSFPSLPQPKNSSTKLVLNGNQAVALGAMAGGVNFCSFYPMTPATGVALNLIHHAQDQGIAIEQAEDEIAAVNMAIGASFTGARSLVPTSGGGFDLMSEGVSLAGITETPLVIFVGQRPGPATGLPTRTEQSDLFLVLYAGHGEFPRAVFAPGTPEECFHLTYKALDLAERFQTTIFLLSDQYLADTSRSVPAFDLDNLPEMAQPDREDSNPGEYERYSFSESGVSPRRLPGAGRSLVVADSDEHTPDGHITEDLQIRNKMLEKRLKKYEGLKEHITAPQINGPEDPELLLVSWGSTYGAVQEAAKILQDKGQKTATLHFSQIWPLNPDHFLDLLHSAKKVVCIESNASGQLSRLLRQETGFHIEANIHRYDGLPINAAYILKHIQ